MHLRALGTLVRVALCIALAAVGAACKKDGDAGTAARPTGTWRSDDGVLLLQFFGRNRLAWYFAAGGGSCVYLAEGTIDADGKVLVSEYDDEYPYELVGDELTIVDPSPMGQLGGTFTQVEFASVCYVDVPPLEVQSASVIELALGADVPVQNGVGKAVALDVPADAVSFALYAFGDTVGTSVAFGALIAPSATNVLDEENLPAGEAESDIQFCTRGYCALVVPKETSVLPSEGPWTAIVVANTEADLAGVSLRAIVRTGPLAPTTFSVRPFVTSAVVPSAQIEDALSEVAALFDAMYGLTLVVEPVTAIDAPEALVQDFLQPDTAAAMTNGDPDSINLFFARRLLGVGGLLGIASGIPASHGVAGPFDGLLVHLENHLDGENALVTDLLVETIAHEMGHMLGLYHPTEADASFFDPIADTPECPLFDPDPLVDANDHDLDMDGMVYVDECSDAGGDNLMFWTPSTTTGAAVVQRSLSSDQVFVIERSLAGH